MPSSLRISTITAAGVTGTRQPAARLRHQRENMTRLHHVLSARIRLDRGQHGMRPVVRRNTGGNALGGFYRYGEIGRQLGLVVAHHQRQRQLLAAFGRQRQANEPTAMSGHEVDIFRTHHAGGHQQVTFVLAILIIHDDDHLAISNILDDFFDTV